MLSITTSSTPELLQCTPFETLGLQQPFEVMVSSNALMMMVSTIQRVIFVGINFHEKIFRKVFADLIFAE